MGNQSVECGKWEILTGGKTHGDLVPNEVAIRDEAGKPKRAVKQSVAGAVHEVLVNGKRRERF